MKLSIILLACFCFVSFVSSSVDDDNEFADFEEFEDEVDPVKVEVNKVPVAKVSENFADDADDGIVIEDEFDKDEFEDFGGQDMDNLDSPPESKTGEPKLNVQVNVPMHLHFRKWDQYWMELIFILGLMVYFLNYQMGRSKNIKLAEKWLSVHKTLLEENFSLVGDDGKKETDITETGMMLKESDSVFTLWCSGRICCEGMLVELKLIKRQDLLSLTMGILSSKTQDQVVIKTEISKDSMDSFVLAVCSKKSASKMKELSDLKQFCISVSKPDEKYNLPAGFTLLSELAEATSAILSDPRVTAILHKYSSVIDSIHVSDQYNATPPDQEGQQAKQPETKKMLVVSFFISDKTDMEELKPLLQLVIYLIDKLKRFKLSREGKLKADKNRSRVEEEFLKSSHAMRMETAAQKKEEKRKQEKEAIMNEANVEKQVKLERKMKKKDAKKAMPKMKSMSIHL